MLSRLGVTGRFRHRVMLLHAYATLPSLVSRRVLTSAAALGVLYAQVRTVERAAASHVRESAGKWERERGFLTHQGLPQAHRRR